MYILLYLEFLVNSFHYFPLFITKESQYYYRGVKINYINRCSQRVSLTNYRCPLEKRQDYNRSSELFISYHYIDMRQCYKLASFDGLAGHKYSEQYSLS